MARRAATILVLIAAGLASLAGQASASPGALRVLIAYSDGAHTEGIIKGQIAAQPGVATVDTVDAGVTTPTVATLETYDAVVTFSNTDFLDSTTLGNNLADFADAGGIVVEFDFDWINVLARQLRGRWATGGYSPYNVGAATVTSSPPVTLGTRDASSPLLSGIPALNTDYRMNTSPAPGAVEVAKWSDGSTAIAFKGRAVGVNTCVADGCSGSDPAFGRLIVNAARMRAVGQLLVPNQACTPNTFIQTGVAAGNSYKAPLPGVVTSWYFQSADPVLPGLKLKVGRTTGLFGLAITGESAAGIQLANQINGPYPARIPVLANDGIGLFTTGGPAFCGRNGVAGDTYSFATGDQPPGSTPTASPSNSTKFTVEAVVEPDVDADGFGDMTQDKCLADPGSVQGCPKADLSIAKVADATTALLGQNVTFTLTALNGGQDAAPAVALKDTLPAGATFVSATPSTGTCTGSTTVSCSFGTLANGATATVKLVATMTSTGSKTNTATIGSTALDQAALNAAGAGDTNAANNSASATVSVAQVAALGAARISNATQTNRRWREPATSKRAQISARRAPVGTRFRFRLDRAATVRFNFTQGVRGRRVGGRCVRATRGNRNKPKCTRRVSRGRLNFAGHAGINNVRFSGWLKTRKLPLGKYTLVITATTPGAGATSARLKFTIVR